MLLVQRKKPGGTIARRRRLPFRWGYVVGDFMEHWYSALRRLSLAAAEFAVMSAAVLTVATIAKYGL
jgi:hypothetical protein